MVLWGECMWGVLEGFIFSLNFFRLGGRCSVFLFRVLYIFRVILGLLYFFLGSGFFIWSIGGCR